MKTTEIAYHMINLQNLITVTSFKFDLISLSKSKNALQIFCSKSLADQELVPQKTKLPPCMDNDC